MKHVVEELRKYLRESSRKEIEEGWNESKDFDNVGIPFKDLINQMVFQHSYGKCESIKVNISENPKFASDFFCVIYSN